MTWRISWTDRALGDAERLDSRTRERVLHALERFAETGHGDVKRLRGTEVEWRVRVGGFRVRFVFDDATNAILVLRVLPRKEAYRQ